MENNKFEFQVKINKKIFDEVYKMLQDQNEIKQYIKNMYEKEFEKYKERLLLLGLYSESMNTRDVSNLKIRPKIYKKRKNKN